MGDSVASNVQATAAHVRAWLRFDLLSEDEAKACSRERERFEKALVRKPGPELRDFLAFAQYEADLGLLVRRRAKRQGLRFSDKRVQVFAADKRVHFIFDRAILRFGHDVRLWREYIRYCEAAQAHKIMSRVIARALQRHSREADLWQRAALIEWQGRRNVHAARALFQRGLRLCSLGRETTLSAHVAAAASAAQRPFSEDESHDIKDRSRVTPLESLWLAYCRMELEYLDIMRERRKILEAEDSRQPTSLDNPEEEPFSLDFDHSNDLNNEDDGEVLSGSNPGSGSDDKDDDESSDDDEDDDEESGSNGSEQGEDSDSDDDGELSLSDMSEGEGSGIEVEAIEGENDVEQVDVSETEDAFWKAGIVRIIFEQAISLLPYSVRLRVEFIKLFGKFPFGGPLETFAVETLRKDYFPSEVLAVQTLAALPPPKRKALSAAYSNSIFEESKKALLRSQDLRSLSTVCRAHVEFCAQRLSQTSPSGEDLLMYNNALRFGAEVSPVLCCRWLSEQAEQAGGNVPPQIAEKVEGWLSKKKSQSDDDRSKHLRQSPRVWKTFCELALCAFSEPGISKEKLLSTYRRGIQACLANRDSFGPSDPAFCDQFRELCLSFVKYWAHSSSSKSTTASFCKAFNAFQTSILSDYAVGSPDLALDLLRSAFFEVAQSSLDKDLLTPGDVRIIINSSLQLPIRATPSLHMGVIAFEIEHAGSTGKELYAAADRAVRDCGKGSGPAIEDLWLTCIELSAKRNEFDRAARYLWRAKRELAKISDSFMQKTSSLGLSSDDA